MAKVKVCNHKRSCDCVLNAIVFGDNLIRDGHYIVNHIGEAIYIDISRITKEEFNQIKNVFFSDLI